MTIPVCGPPGSVAVLTGPDALAGRDLLDPSGTSSNQTPARSLLGLASFSPAEHAINIGCPTLFVTCDDDTIVNTDATHQLAAAIEGATTLTFRGSHFDVFQPTQAPGFARAVLQHFQTALNATAADVSEHVTRQQCADQTQWSRPTGVDAGPLGRSRRDVRVQPSGNAGTTAAAASDRCIR